MQELKDIPTLTPEQMAIISKKGYFATYERLALKTHTKREAFEILEGEYERITGRRRYSEFTNFRRIRIEFYAREKKFKK